jgi:GPH family glycoside/pentoside/hexuronide:cation symporter
MGKESTNLKSTKLEKLSYGVGDVGANLIWSFSSFFLTYYYTDSAGISAAFAGTMMLICRLFDGFSDLIMGVIIDKTKARWGKARSWILFSTIPLVLSYIALYNIPSSLSERGKNVWVSVTYFLLSVIFYTANNLAYHAMLPRFSLDSEDRGAVSVVRTMLSTATILIMNIVTPILFTVFGGKDKQGTWSKITLIYGILAVICLFITFFGVKEKLPIEETNKGKPDEEKAKVPLKVSLSLLLKSRYFYIAIILFFAFFVSSGVGGIGIYYMTNVLGSASYYSIQSIAGLIPTVLVLPFIPMLYKKFGKRNSMLGGLFITLIAGGIMLLNPMNPVVYLSMILVRGIGNSALSVAIFTLAGDIVDYNDMKTGIRTEGIATAANTVGQKLGAGLGSALLGWLLAWGHYNGALDVQPDSAINAMILLAIGVPMIVSTIAFILLLFWDLEKYQLDVKAYLEEKTKEQ